MSKRSSRSRSHSRSETAIIYPFFPIFLFILLLLTFGTPIASAHTIISRDTAFADHVSEHGHPLNRQVDVSEDGAADLAPGNKQDEAGIQERQDGFDAQDVTRDNDGWSVLGSGHFKKRAVFTFAGDELPDGLQKSSYTVECNDACQDSSQTIYNELFDPENVQVSNGFLTLTVPGGQIPENADNTISCAEVTTMEENILYASVRTVAILSDVPGTCHGLFPCQQHW